MDTNSPNPADYETMAMETAAFAPLDPMQGETLAANIQQAITTICTGTGSESFSGVNVIYRSWAILPGDPEAQEEVDRIPRRVFGVPNPTHADFLIRGFRKKQNPSSLILPLNS